MNGSPCVMMIRKEGGFTLQGSVPFKRLAWSGPAHPHTFYMWSLNGK